MILKVTDKRSRRLLSSRIVMLRGEKNYTIIYLDDGRQLLNAYTLKRYETQLRTEGFLRVHRAYVINPSFLSQYDAEANTILLKNGLKATVSRRRMPAVKEFMKGIGNV